MMNEKAQRILFIEPNACDREIIPNENLSISVELKTITRGRSVITGNGNEGTGSIENNDNDGKGAKTIGFLEGSPVGGRRSLTTNYTEVNTNFSTDGENDLEALGIESINIKFDTAYIPQISIKFVDIRGHSVLQKGSKSKYKMFFELPYPIFELTVKGFYGKAVTYCLHLKSWNASFNSQTGNFEIQTEFIGYTYALLTDCIMGYMRATALTTRGKTLFNKYKNEKENGSLKYPSLITIDEFLNYVDKVGRDFKKLKEDSHEIKQINSLTALSITLKKLNSSIVKLGKDISKQGSIDLLNSNLSDLILISKNNVNDEVETLINKYKSETRRDWDGNEDFEGINSRIELPALKINAGSIINVKKTRLLASDFEDVDKLSNALKSNGSGAYGSSDLRKVVAEKLIRNFIIKQNTTEVILYDFSNPFSEVERVFNESKARKTKLTKKLTAELKSKVSESSFKPTIRNIIDLLAIHAQIFLETIKQVSKDAEGVNGNPERTRILVERLTYKGMDLNKSNKKIYPWPEYKSIQQSNALSLDNPENAESSDTALYETWIGSKLLEREYSSVPEVSFVEELLEKLMNISKSDEERTNNSFGKSPNFYPVSPIDAAIPIDTIGADAVNTSLITQNPYHKAIYKDNGENQLTTPFEAYRCLIIRGFNAFGLSNRIISSKQIKIMGTLEADNLFNVISSELTKVKKTTMINSISNLQAGKPEDQARSVLTKWENGVKNEVINPPNNLDGKLLERETITGDNASPSTFYKYVYIKDDPYFPSSATNRYRTYLPVSGGFNCKSFFKNNKLKDAEELKKLSSTLLFVGNRVSSMPSLIREFEDDRPRMEEEDGAVYLKIIDNSLYDDGINNPVFGNEPLKEYIDNVGDKSLLSQDGLFKTTYNDSDLLTEKLNMYNGRYGTLEINNVVYDYTGRGNDMFYDESQYKREHHYNDEDIENVFGANSGNIISMFYSQPMPINGLLGLSDFTMPNGTFLAKKETENFKKFYKIKEQGEYKVFQDSQNRSRKKYTPTEYGNQKYLIGEVAKNKEDAGVYLPFLEFSVIRYDDSNQFHFSLFGSKFYYAQTLEAGKAFLFLHSISWEGVFGRIRNQGEGNFQFQGGANAGYDGYIPIATSLFDTTIFGTEGLKNETSFKNIDMAADIKGLFSNVGSFIKAPKLWCAFIGALLYRYDFKFRASADILDWEHDNTPLLPFQDKKSYTPSEDEYLYDINNGISSCGINFFFDSDKEKEKNNDRDDNDAGSYAKIDKVILGLPPQVRDEFKRIFLEFVDGDFNVIKKHYELFENVSEMETNVYHLRTDIKETKQTKEIHEAGYTVGGGPMGGSYHVPATTRTISLDSKFTLTKQNVINRFGVKYKSAIFNYSNISPINDQDWSETTLTNQYRQKHVLDLTMKPNTSANRFLCNLLGETCTIMNNRPSIFRVNIGENYLNPLRRARSGVANERPETSMEGIDRYQPIRVSTDIMDLYVESFFKRFNKLAKDFSDPEVDENDKYQKKIFNSVDDDTIKLSIYRTLSSINSKWIGGDVKNQCANISKIAESFTYLDSSFYEIGDKFLINPKTVYNKIQGNYNQSFFEVVNTILTKNDFNFIPLPSFINFKQEKELQDAFKPYSYAKGVKSASVKPSFVCIYTGQKSTNLDLGSESEHPDDGVYIQNDGCGTMTGELPKIFAGGGTNKALKIPYFLVSYGKDNQSFFKDVKLDQREFVETAESLEIIEDISNSGNKRKPTFNGQNLFNVYQKRSYSAEVEMMGNAMIQPMMYFQLNNIPMFRGAYLINNVTHNITPHNMTTTFKGQRIKNSKVKLIDENQLFMNLLGPLQSAGASEVISDTANNTSGRRIITQSVETTSADGTTTNLIRTTLEDNSSSNSTSRSTPNSGVKINPTDVIII